MPVEGLIEGIKGAIIDPLIIFLAAAAGLFLVWGLVTFLSNSGTEEARNQARQHMLWGIIGLVIIIAAQGLIEIVLATFGI